MLAAGAGGAVDLHLIILGLDLHILTVVGNIGNHLHGRERGLPPGVGIKGGNPHKPVDTVFPFQETVGVLALNHDIGGFQPRFIPFQIIQDLVGEAVSLRPTGIHPVKHLTPVLCFRSASARVEAHKGIVLVIVPGEQGFQTTGLHLLLQPGEAFLQFLQHGVVVLFLRHLADGSQIVPGINHLLVPFQFVLQLPGLYCDLLAPLRVIPEAGGLLHSVEPLQLILRPLQIEGIRQTVQSRPAVIEFLLIGIKGNIHKSYSHFCKIA